MDKERQFLMLLFMIEPHKMLDVLKELLRIAEQSSFDDLLPIRYDGDRR